MTLRSYAPVIVYFHLLLDRPPAHKCVWGQKRGNHLALLTASCPGTSELKGTSNYWTGPALRLVEDSLSLTPARPSPLHFVPSRPIPCQHPLSNHNTSTVPATNPYAHLRPLDVSFTKPHHCTLLSAPTTSSYRSDSLQPTHSMLSFCMLHINV